MTNQVGGNHYQNLAIQPWEYNVKNNLGWAEGEVVKYVTRWKAKNGVEDLRKARSVIDFLIRETLNAGEGESKPTVFLKKTHRPVVPYELTEHEAAGLD